MRLSVLPFFFGFLVYVLSILSSVVRLLIEEREERMEVKDLIFTYVKFQRVDFVQYFWMILGISLSYGFFF